MKNLDGLFFGGGKYMDPWDFKRIIHQKCGNQVELSRKVLMGECKVSRIIRGIQQPSPEEAEVIARVLGVPVEELFPSREGRSDGR
jgi:hypothetical protein